MTYQIMVVEDEQGLADLLEYFLGDLGYDVITANNGQVALEMLQQPSQTVNLIISDVMMPIKDGYEFVQELRTFPLLAKIPILLISAVPINRAKLNPGKSVVCMTKPYDLNQLELAVYSLIDWL